MRKARRISQKSAELPLVTSTRHATQAAITIISKNYLSYAKTLALSYKKFHPKHDFIIVLITPNIYAVEEVLAAKQWALSPASVVQMFMESDCMDAAVATAFAHNSVMQKSF